MRAALRESWMLAPSVFVALALVLTGCATTDGDLGRPVDSVTGAGVSSYRTEPVLVPAGQASAGTRTEIVLGKEVDHWSATITSPGLTVELEASGVRAFDGQRIAADAVVAIRESLTEAEAVRFDSLDGAVSGALEAYLGGLSPGMCAL